MDTCCVCGRKGDGVILTVFSQVSKDLWCSGIARLASCRCYACSNPLACTLFLGISRPVRVLRAHRPVPGPRERLVLMARVPRALHGLLPQNNPRDIQRDIRR